jgi:hypothetical protein
MQTKTISITLANATHAWLEEQARTEGTTAAEIVARLVEAEQARAAMESTAAWARDDDDAPTLDEVDRARAMAAGDRQR